MYQYRLRFSDCIFVIFQRLQTRNEYSSTGTGLAMVKRCVKAHGGEIVLQSEVGRGTTFTVTLPTIKGIGDLCPAHMQSRGQLKRRGDRILTAYRSLLNSR